MNIVELEQVEKRYRGVHALKGLNLTLKEGEILGLFGHNGAGKTTTIKLILGLIEASRGKVRVFGSDPTRSEARNQRRQLGFLQENVSFYDQLSGLEVLNYFARLKQIPQQQCLALLNQVGLQHAQNRRVKTYSKGMRQRLGLAQALLGEPKLLLLDEPTVGLDPLATQDFYQRLKYLQEQGCSVIICSHVLPGVEKYIDRALIMGRGELLAEGNLHDLRQQADLPLSLQLQGDIVLPAALQEYLIPSPLSVGSSRHHAAASSPETCLQIQVQQLQGDIELPATLQAYAPPNPLDSGSSPRHRAANRPELSLQIPMQQKMPVLRSLMALPGLENLELQLPTLEDLYSHFTGAMQLGSLELGPQELLEAQRR